MEHMNNIISTDQSDAALIWGEESGFIYPSGDYITRPRSVLAISQRESLKFFLVSGHKLTIWRFK